jgi:hypothetical protein
LLIKKFLGSVIVRDVEKFVPMYEKINIDALVKSMGEAVY